MATEDADTSDSGQVSGAEQSDSSASEATGGSARVRDYTWADFMGEHGYGDQIERLYPDDADEEGLAVPSGDDWDGVEFDPAEYLGMDPDELPARLREEAGRKAAFVDELIRAELDRAEHPVAKGRYTWEEFKSEYYYEDGEPPRDGDGDVVPFDPEEYLGFEPEATEGVLSSAENVASELSEVVDERTVTTMDQFGEEELQAMPNVDEEDVEAFDEDEFFSDEDGNTTVVNRYDLEKAVPMEKKRHFLEEGRYWVNEPYSFVVIFHSVKENEKKYYAVEPYLDEIEDDLIEFLEGKLRNAIKYSDDDVVVEGSEEDRGEVIERETRRLLRRYGLYDDSADGSGGDGLLATIRGLLGDEEAGEASDHEGFDGIEVRPEPAVLEDDPQTVNEYQVEKLLYYLKRDFIGYERIDPIKQDTVNVEDVSCDGYNSPVFVYHSEYEQIITNIYHGETELDDFVVKLAQRSGKGISKRNPQVDATLPDGSRAQLTLGREVSDHGTNYTIRQFKEVPFTPIDQIAWNTLSLQETAFLWLAIENDKSMIIAGGTATGKTTLLNALSLFIPSSAKIVSIEDTREVQLPQRNWVASVTRPSFGEDDTGDVDEFDLLEAALRQRPEYIVMGEVRGEEGRDLFQVMSTGHTSYSTFHADSVGEVLKRFTTDPINVSKTMFTALDLVAIQTRTRVGGHKVVRNKNLTEINHYDAENDEINVQDVYQWQAETDEFLKMGDSNTLEEIMFDRGWSYDRLQDELFKREVILAYLIENGLNTYTEVAATIQAFINDPETILTLVANGRLQNSLEDLREMESVLIDVDPEKEEMAPRPAPGEETEQRCLDILDRAEDSLFEEFRGKETRGLASALEDPEPEMPPPSELSVPEEEEDIEFSGQLSEDAIDHAELEMASDEEEPFAFEGEAPEDQPALEEADAAVAADEPTGDEPAAADDGSTTTVDAADDAGTESGLGADESQEDAPDWLFGEDGADDGPDGGGGLAFGGSDDDAGSEPTDDDGFGFDDGDSGDDGGSGLEFDPAPEDDDDDAGADSDESDPDDGGFAFEEGGDELAFGDDEGGDELAFGDDDADDGADDEEGGLAFDETAEETIEDGGFAFDGDEEVTPEDDGDEEGST